MKGQEREENKTMDLFFVRFLVSSFISSCLILAILAIKKVLQKHILAKWQYNMWVLFLLILIIPFIPQQFLNFAKVYKWAFNPINLNENIVANINTLSNMGDTLFYRGKGIQDFTLSVDRSIVTYLNLMCMGIWLVGIVVYTIVMIICNYDIRRVKHSIQPIKNKEIEAVFEQCKINLKITKSVILGKSALVQSPMAVGFINTYIIIPTRTMKQLSVKDINYIILHELNHYKNKDILINDIMCFFQIVYWFNPFVHLAFKEMRMDRELACDASVLKMIDEKHYINYGRTIISFAEKVSQPRHLTMMTGMSGSKKQIKKRIEKIASFKVETKLVQIKSILIFALVGVLIFSHVSVISIMAYDNNKYDFKEDQVIYEDLSAYFDGTNGSFVLYDLQAEQYSIYNKAKSIKRVSPDSTYKIYSALIGLESNVIQDGHSIRNFNGERYPYDSWNQDQDLSSAMENSVNWYFQDMDKSVGQEKLQYYFDQIKYGNSNLAGGISNYWIQSSLRISPIEQVELLKDFYTYDCVFQPNNINSVKEVLKLSEKDGAVLSGKTGTGMVNGKGVNGWFIGYVERDEKTFIFATNIEDKEGVSGSVAAQITLSILNDKNIY